MVIEKIPFADTLQWVFRVFKNKTFHLSSPFLLMCRFFPVDAHQSGKSVWTEGGGGITRVPMKTQQGVYYEICLLEWKQGCREMLQYPSNGKEVKTNDLEKSCLIKTAVRDVCVYLTYFFSNQSSVPWKAWDAYGLEVHLGLS